MVQVEITELGEHVLKDKVLVVYHFDLSLGFIVNNHHHLMWATCTDDIVRSTYMSFKNVDFFKAVFGHTTGLRCFSWMLTMHFVTLYKCSSSSHQIVALFSHIFNHSVFTGLLGVYKVDQRVSMSKKVLFVQGICGTDRRGTSESPFLFWWQAARHVFKQREASHLGLWCSAQIAQHRQLPPASHCQRLLTLRHLHVSRHILICHYRWERVLSTCQISKGHATHCLYTT